MEFDIGDAPRKVEDGVTFIWDEAKRAWFPMWDEKLVESQQSAYSSNQTETTLKVLDSKAEVASSAKKKHKKRPGDDDDEDSAKRAKKDRPITSVYVSGLPADVTVDEINETFAKYGIIMEDVHTGEPKIKIYRDDKGLCKGDALVTYFKEESVNLAVDLLDESQFRYGSPVNMRVQRAEFKSEPKEKSAETGAKVVVSKDDKKKLARKIQQLEKRLDWFEQEKGAKSSKFSKIVILKGMFTKAEIDQDPTLLLDLKEDVTQEFSVFGEITNVVVYDGSDEGVISVRFKDQSSADACVAKNNGRFFGGRRISASIYDGKEKFKEHKSQEDKEQEEAQRLAAFEKWLEDNH